MGFVRYIMWICDVNEEENEIYAEGVKEGDKDGERISLTMVYDDLKENVSEEEFSQLIDMHQVNSHSVKVLPDLRTGRIFIIEGDEDGDDEKFIVPEYEPFTQEEIDEAEKWAEEMAKNFKWDK